MIPSIEDIRQRLSFLKMVPDRNFYDWSIGHYIVRIFTPASDSHTFNDPILKHDNITIHPTVNVHLIELSKHPNQDNLPYDATIEIYLDLREVEPFKSYRPIWYNTFTSPGGIINLSDGRDMPITQLCELIRLLHRLANLAVFL